MDRIPEIDLEVCGLSLTEARGWEFGVSEPRVIGIELDELLFPPGVPTGGNVRLSAHETW